MANQIDKSTTTFRYGFSNDEQFQEWISNLKECNAIAFVGRSNVGKSSLINALFGNKTARTSKTPGRTREINVFTFKLRSDNSEEPIEHEFYLFDLPGYGHASVSKEMSQNWNKLMNSFFQHGKAHNILMLNIQDIRHPAQKADMAFHDYLRDFDFNTNIVFNKLDKLKTQKERAKIKKEQKNLFEKFKHAKQIYYVSAEKRTGVPELEMGAINFLLAPFQEQGSDQEID